MTSDGAASDAPATEAQHSGGHRTQWADVVGRWAFLVVFALVVMVFWAMRPNTFGTLGNLSIVINRAAIPLILGCAVTLVLSCSEFDLAGPNLADFGSVVIGVLVTTGGMQSGIGPWLAIAAGLLCPLTFGAVTGAAVTYGRVPSFVASLAVGSAAAGMELATQSRIEGGLKQIVTIALPDQIRDLNTTTLLWTNIRLSVLIAFGVALSIWITLRFTVFGRHVLAIGGNADAAYLAAVPITRVRLIVFTVAGLLAGVAGLLGLAERGYFTGASPPLLLQSYTAAFLGTAVLALRRFTIGGTAAAVLFLQVMSNGLGLLNQPTWIVSVVNGTVLLTAVVLTRGRHR